MREKPFLNVSDGRNGGITPACAGKTRTVGCLSTLPKDHPRVCGKNHDSAEQKITQEGSPPRVREKPVTSLSKALGGRITPACAGKTPKVRYLPSDFRDHPRVCGKNFHDIQRKLQPLGSPPRVREKRVHSLPLINSQRITPACAGKTGRNVEYLLPAGDHPRVCGKNE